jgi:hypothetical protein
MNIRQIYGQQESWWEPWKEAWQSQPNWDFVGGLIGLAGIAIILISAFSLERFPVSSVPYVLWSGCALFLAGKSIIMFAA